MNKPYVSPGERFGPGKVRAGPSATFLMELLSMLVIPLLLIALHISEAVTKLKEWRIATFGEVRFLRRDFRLLWRWLTWKQRWSLLAFDRFVVTGRGRYCLRAEYNFNVSCGSARHGFFCFQSSVPLPLYSHLLAQKLQLEADGLPTCAWPRSIPAPNPPSNMVNHS